MINLDKYLKTNYKYFLENLEYKLLAPAVPGTVMQLECRDHLDASMASEDKIRVAFTRTLKFDPECVYKLTVTYGAVAEINELGLKEVDWDSINLSNEMRNGQCGLLDALVSRASMQISQITSASGQAPMITPPKIARTQNPTA